MLRDRIQAHLDTIERAYRVTILNREDVTRWIVAVVRDERQLLPVMTALNTWIAVETRSGAVEVPRDVVERILSNNRGF